MVLRRNMRHFSVYSCWISLCLLAVSCHYERKNRENPSFRIRSAGFHYTEITGIGFEPGITRRDPSDVIRVGDTCYVFYTKVYGKSPGYWGTIWYATSADMGYHWVEQGQALDIGDPGSFDSFGVFTPNIFCFENTYYLYYTGVQPTPGRRDGQFENNSINDYTALGVAISDVPSGPFIRATGAPLLTTTLDSLAFDSYRVDDAAVLFRNDTIWLYYKGRSRAHGTQGPGKTRMGVAWSHQPEGPFQKYGTDILSESHEVLIWPEGQGVAALASLSSTIEFAPNGHDFMSPKLSLPVENRPHAPGLFRPDLTDPADRNNSFEWGLSMVHNGADCYLIRFDCQVNTLNESL